MKADSIYYNGNIITVDKNFSIVSAAAVANGRFIAVGNDDEILRLAGPDTEKVDLNSDTMLPGAVDSHMHAALYGWMLSQKAVNFKKRVLTSISALCALIEEYANKSPDGEWLYGMGYMEFLLNDLQTREQGGLNRFDIDKACKNHPAMFLDFGAHTLLANSKALELCGLDSSVADVPEYMGQIGRFADGSLTGVFSDWGAQSVMGRHAAQLSDEEIEKSILRMQANLNSLGITMHTDILGIGGNDLIGGLWSERVINIYHKLAIERRLTADVSIGILPGPGGNQSFESIQRGLSEMKLPELSPDEGVRAGKIKLFGDSVTWHRNADSAGIPHGRSAFPGSSDEEQQEQMERIILCLHKLGWQIEIHAIGGKAIDTMLDAFVKAEQLYQADKAMRHIIIHADELTPNRLDEISKNEIIIAQQPTAKKLMSQFMPAGITVCSCNDYEIHNVKVTCGSDAFVFEPGWLSGAADLLDTEKNCTSDVIKQIIKMYTINGAYQEHCETSTGSIETGKYASFQILDGNPLEADCVKLRSIKIKKTIYRGKTVYT